MISFSQYTEIHFLRSQEGLGIQQIAQKMSLNDKTVTKWLACDRYEARRNKGRSGKLDPHKATIRSLLEKHPTALSKSSSAWSKGVITTAVTRSSKTTCARFAHVHRKPT